MKKKIAMILCAALVMGMTACAPEEGPQTVQVEKIGGGAVEETQADAEKTEENTEKVQADVESGSTAQTENSEETYYLRNYEADVLYEVDKDGNPVGVYSDTQARNAFERAGVNYGDVSCRMIVNGIGYYYTCDYQFNDDVTIHDYTFYAYDFDSDRLKTVYSISTEGNMETYDCYQGRVYLYFQNGYQYSSVAFDVDKANMTFTEAVQDNAALLQAMNGWVVNNSVTGWVDYTAPERLFDQIGYVICCNQSWETEDGISKFRRVFRDGTTEELPELEGTDVYLRFASDNWVVTDRYDVDALQALNLTTREVVKFAGAQPDQKPQTLVHAGDKIYYYYATESETEYDIYSYQVYSFDWSTGKNELILETATVPGTGNVRSGLDGFRIIGDMPYAMALVDSKLEWVRIQDGKYITIGCPIRELSAFRYGHVIYNTVRMKCPYCAADLYGEYAEAFVLDDQYSAQAAKINEALAAGLQNMDQHFTLPTDNSECDWHSQAEYQTMETNETWVKDVTILNDRFLSVYYTGYWYGGGVHGYPSRSQRLFDLTTGEELSDMDLYTGTEEQFKTYVAEQTKKYYADHSDYFFAATAEEAYNSAYESASLQSGLVVWGETSATYLFTPYDLGPYSSGYIEIELPYDELLGMDLLSALNAEHPAKTE